MQAARPRIPRRLPPCVRLPVQSSSNVLGYVLIFSPRELVPLAFAICDDKAAKSMTSLRSYCGRGMFLVSPAGFARVNCRRRDGFFWSRCVDRTAGVRDCRYALCPRWFLARTSNDVGLTTTGNTPHASTTCVIDQRMAQLVGMSVGWILFVQLRSWPARVGARRRHGREAGHEESRLTPIRDTSKAL